MTCDNNNNIYVSGNNDNIIIAKPTSYSTTLYTKSGGISSNGDGCYYDFSNNHLWVTSSVGTVGVYSFSAGVITGVVYSNTNYNISSYPVANLITSNVGTNAVTNARFMYCKKDKQNNLVVTDYGNNCIYRISPGSDNKYGMFPGSVIPTFKLLVANGNSNAYFNVTTNTLSAPHDIVFIGNDAYFSTRGTHVICKIQNYALIP
jgi:hypothetical protein